MICVWLGVWSDVGPGKEKCVVVHAPRLMFYCVMLYSAVHAARLSPCLRAWTISACLNNHTDESWFRSFYNSPLAVNSQSRRRLQGEGTGNAPLLIYSACILYTVKIRLNTLHCLLYTVKFTLDTLTVTYTEQASTYCCPCSSESIGWREGGNGY